MVSYLSWCLTYVALPPFPTETDYLLITYTYLLASSCLDINIEYSIKAWTCMERARKGAIDILAHDDDLTELFGCGSLLWLMTGLN